MLTLLSRLVRPRQKSAASHLTVTIYTREQCGCCHKALDLLKDYQRGHGFTIEEIDVDTDADLTARYGLTVPVVAIEGKVRFKGVVNPMLLERLLLAESQGR